ncbi:hypothetical protein F5148DRAFT_771931 [Russula earlei]|uniref:Uncharacterized protein n=1 Tax=Russula earlei TaxID=71964 RepID=A0ACC0UDF7_9AGAM|nr:hypothetical protein F5148DRAFT_771931 [Russula earlei]
MSLGGEQGNHSKGLTNHKAKQWQRGTRDTCTWKGKGRETGESTTEDQGRVTSSVGSEIWEAYDPIIIYGLPIFRSSAHLVTALSPARSIQKKSFAKVHAGFQAVLGGGATQAKKTDPRIQKKWTRTSRRGRAARVASRHATALQGPAAAETLRKSPASGRGLGAGRRVPPSHADRLLCPFSYDAIARTSGGRPHLTASSCFESAVARRFPN